MLDNENIQIDYDDNEVNWCTYIILLFENNDKYFLSNKQRNVTIFLHRTHIPLKRLILHRPCFAAQIPRWLNTNSKQTKTQKVTCVHTSIILLSDR